MFILSQIEHLILFSKATFYIIFIKKFITKLFYKECTNKLKTNKTRIFYEESS